MKPKPSSKTTRRTRPSPTTAFSPGRPRSDGHASRRPPARKPARPLSAPLTPREAEVLLWIAEGKRNREIALILAISPETVKKHVRSIFEKMGVETRAAAAARAARPPFRKQDK